MKDFKDLAAHINKEAEKFKQSLEEARIETAEETGNLAQSLAPVRTGELRNSKVVEHLQDSSIVGFTASHAPIIEYGSSRQSAQPFLTPAAHQSEHIFPAKLQKKAKEK